MNLSFLNFILIYFSAKQGSKEIEERSPEKEKRKPKLRSDERKERKMSRKRVSLVLSAHTLSPSMSEDLTFY